MIYDVIYAHTLSFGSLLKYPVDFLNDRVENEGWLRALRARLPDTIGTGTHRRWQIFRILRAPNDA